LDENKHKETTTRETNLVKKDERSQKVPDSVEAARCQGPTSEGIGVERFLCEQNKRMTERLAINLHPILVLFVFSHKGFNGHPD
jgi:hypothetical protein